MDGNYFNLHIPALDLCNESDIPEFPCSYKSPDKLKNVLTNYKKGAFSLLTFNVRSCRKNFGCFLSFLSNLMFRFSIVVLIETWLSSSADCGFDIDGYKHVSVHRNNFGGGMKIYYDEQYNVEVINELTFINNCMEVLTMYLIGLDFRYIICSVYRSPCADPHTFNEQFFNNVLNKFPIDAKVLITGDFNLNLFNPLKNTFIDVFTASMLSCGFFPVITLPAKINDGNSVTPYSLIDQLWVNFKDGSEHESGVALFPLTDHFPIYYMFKGNCRGIHKVIESRQITANTISTFISSMSRIDFTPVLNCDDVNIAVGLFWEKLWKMYNSSFPIKRKKVKSNLINAPWITPEIKKCIKKKYRLFNYFKRGLIQKRQFIMYKNALNWVINRVRSKYYHQKFESCIANSKKTWSNVNQILGRGRQEPVCRIVTEGGRIVEGNSMAESFNLFFTSIVSRITESLPREINFDYFRNIDYVPQSCFLMPTDEGEVVEILRGMPNKGNSLIDIKPSILVLISGILGKVVAYLYNLSILNGTYPNILKIGRITPVFKNGDVLRINNYRPITNLLNLNKIFELLTYRRIMKFIDRFDLLNRLQYGFRKARNTTQAIFRLTSDMLNTFHEKSYTVALFLDLSKAFDTISREILVHKLSIYGFRGVTNSFLSSYLSERKQYVNIGNFKSSTEFINHGVPQGSVLGPLLFNIYINDIVKVGDAKKILFADDAVFYITERTLEMCIVKIKQLINDLSEWLKNNKLVANVNKTKLMMVTPRPFDDLPDVYFNGTKLEWVSNIKYLGVIIDNKLSFLPQASEVFMKVSKMHGIFYSLSSLVPRATLLTIYNSLVYPLITQNMLIWGGISPANLKNIKTMMNNILRCILKVERDDNNVPMVSVNNMYRSLNLLQFDDIYKFLLLKFLHLAFYKNRDLFNEYFLPLLPSHTYNTRNVRINLPVIRLEVERHFALFQCCKLLGELPDELLEPQSDYSLKVKYKSFVLSRY